MRLKAILVSFAVLCAFALAWPQPAAAAITIATVPVGNPGNANDPYTSNQYGGVAYNYSIGEYDVTVGQYTAFLNAVAATDTYGLYDSNMASDLNIAGISQSGSSGSYNYSVIGSANHPITYVSWGDAARFANWLNNGQPTGGETLSTTEDGSYYLNGATSQAALNAVTRKATASWVIPTENEWYKAAYYNPTTSTYYQYPFSSSTVPTSAMPGSTPNTGNFTTSNSYVFAVTGSSSYSSTQNYLTDVGTYTASASPYGAFDMGGDVFQWNEVLISGSSRGARGGSWLNDSFLLPSSNRYYYLDPSLGNASFGFRVATVPEARAEVLGDFNLDTHVTAADILPMMAALANLHGYEQTNGLTNSQLLAIGDINGDGVVNNADLQELLNLLQSGGGSAGAVPEPASLVLLAAGSLMLLLRRGRALLARTPHSCQNGRCA